MGAPVASATQLTGWLWSGSTDTADPATSAYIGTGWWSLNGATTTGAPYGVTMDDTTHLLTGYAWNSIVDVAGQEIGYGWMSFTPSDIDLAHCPRAAVGDCKQAEVTAGTLSGWARILQFCDTGNLLNGYLRDRKCDAGDDGENSGGFDGWVRFNAKAITGVPVEYENTVNTSTGKLSGYAYSGDLGGIGAAGLSVVHGTSCVGGVPVANNEQQLFTSPPGTSESKNFRACIGTKDVTADSFTTWSDDITGSSVNIVEWTPAASGILKLNNSPVNGTENLSVKSTSPEITAGVGSSVVNFFARYSCVPTRCYDPGTGVDIDSSKICHGQSVTGKSNCNQPCTVDGTKVCDSTWKEVAP